MGFLNRDLLIALTATFVFFFTSAVVEISSGEENLLYPVLAAYLGLAAVIWIDHRLRGRHRIGWFWSTYWRILVAGIAFNALANAIAGIGGVLVAISVFALTAAGIWGGLWWATTYFDDVVEQAELESVKDAFR